MRERIRITAPPVDGNIRNNADAKVKMLSRLGQLVEVANQLSPLYTLPCVYNEVLKARVKRFAPWMGDANKSAISFAVITDCRDDAAVRGEDSLAGGQFKVDAVMSEDRFGAHNKAAVVLRPGPPLLNDTPPTFKWRCQVDAFRFVTPVFD